MVGIVIVSHSHELALEVRAMALQMCRDRDVVITAAGGMEDGAFGTSFDKIEIAVREAYSDDGVLILMDLGSAVMTARMVVEMLAPEQQAKVRLGNAPLVEGAIAAAANAAAGQSLDGVQRAAEQVLIEIPKIDAAEPCKKDIPDRAGAEEETPLPWISVDVVVPNPLGLHARPAMRFVQTASQFQAQVTLQNLTQKGLPVNAKMAMQVAFGATARQGQQIRIKAAGENAHEALARLSTLVESGFGEIEKEPPLPPPADVPSPMKIEIYKEPPPKRIQGLGVSEGYVVAPAFVYPPAGFANRSITAHEPAAPDEEVARLREALHKARAQLEELQMQIGAELDETTGRIFEFQRMILEDTQFVEQMENEISAVKCTAESAICKVLAAWKDKAAALDEIMRARAVDLQDVENRLLRIMGANMAGDRIGLERPSIIVAADLTPSDVTQLDRTLVCGIATAAGGATSHTAILARTRGIPAVMGLGEAILAVAVKTRLALDGSTGLLEVDPSDETIAAYRKQAHQFVEFQAKALAAADQPAITQDGTQVAVKANAGDPDSVREALRSGADGIGLLRTEFLYLNRSTIPGEEEQFQVYREIVEIMGSRPVVMRTLDAGGDKLLPGFGVGPEPNPFLGMRAIRLCLKRPEIFQPQLRAILRAAVAGDVKIMFPLIATLEEVSGAKAALFDAKDSLARDGLEYAADIEVGIMIETPAAAVNADILAHEVDFFSIGSNDLTQYTLACDRGNRDMDYLFDTWNPAVLRLIRRVIEGAHAAGKWVGLCGEFAGQQEAIPFLLGLGLDEFSVAPARLPVVKQRIRQLDSAACRAATEKRFK